MRDERLIVNNLCFILQPSAFILFRMVRRVGFEPTLPRLKGECLNQLGHRRANRADLPVCGDKLKKLVTKTVGKRGAGPASSDKGRTGPLRAKVCISSFPCPHRSREIRV